MPKTTTPTGTPDVLDPKFEPLMLGPSTRMRIYAEDEADINYVADETGLEPLEVKRRAVHLGVCQLLHQLKERNGVTNS